MPGEISISAYQERLSNLERDLSICHTEVEQLRQDRDHLDDLHRSLLQVKNATQAKLQASEDLNKSLATRLDECNAKSYQLQSALVTLRTSIEDESSSELDNARRELVAHREKAQGNYWAWQGNGEDHLESLSFACPVMISATQLKAITDHCAELEAVNVKLREACQLSVEAWSDLRSGSREPMSYWLKKPENEEKVFNMVISLNNLSKALSTPTDRSALVSLLEPTIEIVKSLKDAVNEVAAHGSCDCEGGDLCLFCECTNLVEPATKELARLESLCKPK
jgi:hypothetical protein